MDKLAIWKDKMKDKGIRCTEQRSIILKVLIEGQRPMSAQEIFAEIKEKYQKFRLSTVYRNLNFFESQDFVTRLSLNTRENKFELLAGEHHHHLICIECGDIIPLDCPLEDYEDKLCQETDYNILDHKLKIYGICPRCQ